MYWIWRLIVTIRLFLFLVFLGIAAFYWSHYLFQKYLEGVMGSKVEYSLDYPELLRGNLYFKNLKVYNNSLLPTLNIYNLKINYNVFTAFNRRQVINSISATDVDINCIYDLKGYSLTLLLDKVTSYTKYKSIGSVQINEIFIRNLCINTYVGYGKTNSLHINDIYVDKSRIFSSVYDELIAMLGATAQNPTQEEPTRSKISKITSTVVGWGINAAGIGLQLGGLGVGLLRGLQN